ncbi:hypothetical protein [Deinococcus apachensis]|uniref:hypothetical protein n=1 Tax=Deinococcus apachensis TaxID=309886 RepID=UPI000361C2B9|nr:hypothetical protein [Deinococcus apachensis]
MSLYGTVTPRVPDGTYTFTRVNVYGPSTPVTAVVHDGALFAYTTGTISCPAHLLADYQEGVFAELRHEARYGMVKRVREEVEVAA